MTTLSIITVILLAILILAFYICFKKQDGRIGLRSASACGQLVIVMTAVLFYFLMAQNSAISDAALKPEQYQGFDVFYMSKAAGYMCLIAAVWAIVCFVGGMFMSKTSARFFGSLFNRKIAVNLWILLAALAIVIGGVVLALCLLTAYCPTDYYYVIVPAVLLEGWCLIILTVNTLLDSKGTRRKITLAVFNIINLIAVGYAVISLAVMANEATQGIDIEHVIIAIFAIILMVIALPAIINGTVAVMDCVNMFKTRKSKSKAKGKGKAKAKKA